MKSVLLYIGTVIRLLLLLGIYGLVWYYIGLKGKRILLTKNNKIKKKVYWSIFWFIAFSFILSALLRNILSVNNCAASILTSIGAVSIGALCYLIMIFPTIDIVRFFLKKAGFKGKIKNHISMIYGNGITIFILVALIFCYGMWNAANPIVKNYSISINKKAGKINSLNVVMVSDVHMGIVIKEKGIDKMVSSINKLKPDIVFFCGDMVDESTPTKLKQYYGHAFKNLKSQYGVYYITGNHEYSENVSETINYMKKGNVTVLQDRAVKIDDSFYVVGRNDAASGGQMPLSEIMKGVDKSLPIIELNHRPEGLQEAENGKVDLQLSGHTHEGQYFPNNLLIKLLYEDSYGYLKKGDFNLIVTSGYGTWGPPIRIGTKGEIVNIMLNFKSSSK